MTSKEVAVKKIVVGYDGSDDAVRALEAAAELAGDGARITVVSAIDIPEPAARATAPAEPEEVAEARKALQDAGERLAKLGMRAELVEGFGSPATVIIDEAKARSADLIVVGTRGLAAAERLVLGSVSTKLVHEAPCSVLVAR
jgi:nucleotide-binding universal stress UspA family protein